MLLPTPGPAWQFKVTKKVWNGFKLQNAASQVATQRLVRGNPFSSPELVHVPFPFLIGPHQPPSVNLV